VLTERGELEPSDVRSVAAELADLATWDDAEGVDEGASNDDVSAPDRR
jgi:hypothetical protein